MQLTDTKGRLNTIELAVGKLYHSHRGSFDHDQLIGQPEGQVVATTGGDQYVALRPLLADFVLSMPRGATVVYPKDAGQIVQMGDIYPGARVVEAGAGSGALTMSLLRALGDQGRLVSVERREEFARIARANVESWFGGAHPAWDLRVGELADVLAAFEPGGCDRMVLDMLAPWENIAAAAHALSPGGVLIAYVATTTQLSRFVESLRTDGRFTEPDPWESTIRGWHVDGLAVRPEHRMIGHTGFLVRTRRLAEGARAPERRRRPAPGAHDPQALGWSPDAAAWTPEALGERQVSDRKLRRVGRGIGQAGEAP